MMNCCFRNNNNNNSNDTVTDSNAIDAIVKHELAETGHLLGEVKGQTKIDAAIIAANYAVTNAQYRRSLEEVNELVEEAEASKAMIWARRLSALELVGKKMEATIKTEMVAANFGTGAAASRAYKAAEAARADAEKLWQLEVDFVSDFTTRHPQDAGAARHLILVQELSHRASFGHITAPSGVPLASPSLPSIALTGHCKVEVTKEASKEADVAEDEAKEVGPPDNAEVMIKAAIVAASYASTIGAASAWRAESEQLMRACVDASAKGANARSAVARVAAARRIVAARVRAANEAASYATTAGAARAWHAEGAALLAAEAPALPSVLSSDNSVKSEAKKVQFSTFSNHGQDKKFNGTLTTEVPSTDGSPISVSMNPNELPPPLAI